MLKIKYLGGALMKKRKTKRNVILSVIIFCLLILGVVALTNAQWREKARSFLGIGEEKEKTVPEKTAEGDEEKEDGESVNGSIKLLGKEKISDGAEAEYYELEGLNGDYEVCGVYQDILFVRGEDGEAYYRLKDGKGEKLALSYTQIDDTIELYGEEYAVGFRYAMAGEKMLLEDTFDHRETDFSLAVEGQYKGEWVWLHQGQQNGPHHYILYNVKTGEAEDIVKEILGDIPEVTQFERSPEEGYALVKTEDNEYLLDLENRQAKSLREETGLEGKLSCVFLDETVVHISQITEETEKKMAAGKPYEMNTYNYNRKTGQLKSCVDLSQKYKGKDGVFLGQSPYYYIEQEGEEYILYTPEEEAYRIEGIKNGSISFRLSDDRQKIIAVTNRGGEESDSEANEAGVIDLEKLEMKIFRMEDGEEDFTARFTWVDDCMVIRKADGSGITIYRFD